MTEYEDFIARKLAVSPPTGFEPGEMHKRLFPHQKDLTRWALRRGRAAIFAATGLGKTSCELEWARHVVDRTSKPVLILTPLAVAPQTVLEGAALGLAVTLCRDASNVTAGINVTNYDRLHRFDTSVFGGVVWDESSCAKHFSSKTLAQLKEAFGETPYRLSATATPSPNDYTELGTQAELLGVCKRTEMLSEFFVHDGGETQVWRLKGHARGAFWKWVASWGALVRMPSDLGHDDTGYVLPPLEMHQHVLPATVEEAFSVGRLFVAEAGDLSERRVARRSSVDARVRACAELVNAERDARWIVWAELNAEQDALASIFGDECFSVYGSLDVDEKEERLTRFIRGERRILLTKPAIAAWGLNLQSVARMAFVGVNDSYESHHQSIRRCYRYGQKRSVHVHMFAGEAEGSVLTNLQRKELDADRMSADLSAETRDVVRNEIRRDAQQATPYVSRTISLPHWLQSEHT